MSQPKHQAAGAKGSVSVAMIASNKPLDLKAGSWLKPLAPQGTVAGRDGMMTFKVGTSIVGIALIPQAIPWTALEEACVRALFWTDAAKALKAHTTHVVVSVGDPKLDSVDRALLLTRVICAFLKEFEAVGVYWGAGAVVQSTQIFLDLAAEANRSMLPLHLWMSFRVGAAGSGGVAGYTVGLRAFDQMELEVLQCGYSPADLVDRLFNCAHYLLDKGPVLLDGHTIGLSAEERIEVRHLPSHFGQPGKVIQLQFPKGG